MNACGTLSLGLSLLLGLAALDGCSKKAAPPVSGSGASGNSPLTAPLDYLAAQGRAKQYSTKVISTAQLESAIQQFYAMEERYPTGFDEMVQQHYLGAMPAAPRGKRFTYNPQNGQLGLVAE